MDNKTVFASNLKKIMDKRGKTRREVCEDLDISYYTFSDWVNGKKYPRMDRVEILARYFGIKKSFLIENHAEDDEFDPYAIPNIEPMPKTVKKPLLGTIACGEPILAAENIEEYIDIPDYIKCDFILRCKGNSMINAHIFDGDLVCIKQQPVVNNGEIAAVLIDGEATLKRFSRHGDIVLLKAENPECDDIVIDKTDAKEIRVIGKATHFIGLVK